MVLTDYRGGDNKEGDDDANNMIKAKVILLGDPETGKSQLVQNLKKLKRSKEDSSTALKSDAFFSVVEFSSSELDNSGNDVYLKIWEHSINISSHEEELACRGALICIITLDICSPETANNAFNKWLMLKQNYMSECFLFIVGTGLERSLHRRVQIKDVCRACAQKDAVYVEVSNVDGSNISLLRRLIAQRLIYMLKKRELITAQTEPTSASPISALDIGERISPAPQESTTSQNQANNDDEEEDDEGSDMDNDLHHVRTTVQLANDTLSIPLMEQNILTDSVGSILASYLGADSWPGFEAEEQRLVALGGQLTAFLDRLAQDRSIDITSSVGHIDLASHPLSIDESVYQFEPQKSGSVRKKFLSSSSSGGSGGVSGEGTAGSGDYPEENDFVDSAYSMSELKTAFEIMGLSLPKSLSSAAAAVESNSLLNEIDDELAAAPRKISYLRKMIVRLPDGSTADMVLDLESNIEQQIELFLLSNSISEDDEARRRLFHVLHQIRAEYYVSSGHSAGNSPRSKGTSGSGDDNNSSSGGGGGGDGVDISLLNSPPPPPPPPADGKEGDGGGGDTGDSGTISEEAKLEIRRKLSTVNIQPFARFKAPKKCKLRIVLAGTSASQIELVVQKGEDLLDIAESVKSEYRLSDALRQKVYEQLLDAFEL